MGNVAHLQFLLYVLILDPKASIRGDSIYTVLDLRQKVWARDSWWDSNIDWNPKN